MDRQKWQPDGQTKRQIDRHSSQTYRQGDRLTGIAARWTDKGTVTGLADKGTDRLTGIAARWTDKRTGTD